jgi:hypothetical protein
MSKDIREMINKVKNFKQFVNENNNYSTTNYEMFEKLKTLPYIKYVDRPSGHFLHSIDLKLTDVKYLDDLKDMLIDNNWYLERGRDKSFTITQKYIKEAETTIPEKLYHITPTSNVENILTHGLKPKSEDLRHKFPPRIYVSDNISTLKPLSKELMRWKGKSEYSILKINTNGLDFTLYKDTTSAYKGHYYIQDIDKIPSENISLIE